MYVTLPFFPIPAVVSQNVANESCLVCDKSEKYVVCVTLIPFGSRSMRPDEAEPYTLQYYASYLHWNSLHCFITFIELVPSICVCVSIPTMYPRSIYFIVSNNLIFLWIFEGEISSLPFYDGDAVHCRSDRKSSPSHKSTSAPQVW